MTAKSKPAKARKPRTAAQIAAAAANLRHGPRNGAKPAAAAADADDEMVTISHAVQPGEDLDSIAAAYGTDADALFAANRGVIGSTPQVQVGMPLAVQVTAAVAAAQAAPEEALD